ncbi:MAG: ribonuclease [Candidatus Peribacteria bacterium]|nr:ribonuclease [Candidatus Peribacteria bacterium]
MNLFPDKADREHFVARVIEDALKEENKNDNAQPVFRGWTKDDDDYTEATTSMETHVGGTLYLFTDGGSRGNPGEASIACIVEDPKKGEIVKEHAERIGIETNNVAEYRALIRGLEIAQEFHPNRLVCHLDSELIVRQLNGEYQVKMATLQPLYEKVKILSLQFPDIIFKHIPRSDNHRADALVNKVLNEHRSSYHKPMYSRY